MSSADGVNRTPLPGSDRSVGAPRSGELKNLPKSPEDYVVIENRLAAQKQKPSSSPQLNSIFDELRSRLPKA